SVHDTRNAHSTQKRLIYEQQVCHMRIIKPGLALLGAFLVCASSTYSFDYPLSETASRAAYFMGQRKDDSTGEFLARYDRHFAPPKTGPYVSDVTFFTPFAQLVDYSSRQGQYSAQQAELDGKTKFHTVEITVYIALTETYGPVLSDRAGSAYSPPPLSLRHSDFWKDFKFRVFDGDESLEVDKIYGDPQFLCSEGGCTLS